MNELDSLRQEAETLKNAIRVSEIHIGYICLLTLPLNGCFVCL